MLKFKKIILSLFIAVPILALCFWEWLKTWPQKENFKPEESGSPQIVGEKIEDIDKGSVTFSEKLQWILHLPIKEEYENSLSYVITLIQIAINWIVWMLSTVALVYMLYCGFLVFTSWSDDKNATKGKKWLSTAAIALAWIWISRLIISAMIRFITYTSSSVE